MLTTTYFNLNDFIQNENELSLLMRLMLACNDICLSNYCMKVFKEDVLSNIQKDVKEGAMLYFVRLQCGHLYEAISLIEELDNEINVRNNNILQTTYNKCDVETKSEFLKLTNCLKGRPSYEEFATKVMKMRHKTVFHYNDKKIFRRSIKRHVDEFGRKSSTMTRSTEIKNCRYSVADNVLKTMIFKILWEIESGVNFTSKAEKATDFGYELCKAYIHFCCDFIHQYFKS